MGFGEVRLNVVDWIELTQYMASWLKFVKSLAYVSRLQRSVCFNENGNEFSFHKNKGDLCQLNLSPE
jgi:hypothetical protein